TSDAYAINEDTPLVVAAAQGVLANDTDADGNLRAATLLTGPVHGSLTLNGDGSFEYQPDLNFFGSDSFQYLASDGTTSTSATTVSLMVLPVNDAPALAALADRVTAEGSPLIQAGSFSDPDPDDTWTATVDYGDGTGVQTLAIVGHSFAL